MADKSTTITMAGKIGYEDKITAAQAAQVIAFLNAEGTSELGSPDLTLPGDSSTSRRSAVSTPREALERSQAKTNPEKIVALAAHVLQDGGETFRTDAVKVAFQRAREPLPANMRRDLGAAISQGWVAETDTDGEYYLTHAVAGVLETGFPDSKVGSGRSRSKSTSPKGRPKPKGSKSAKPETFVNIDEFPVTMEGIPDYHAMKANKDKILWALYFVKTQGIAGLNNRDLAWLTDHLGEGVPSKQITAAFNSAKRHGFANRSTVDQTIRIVPAGSEHLQGLLIEKT